jgi:hypothetical protein
MLQRVVASILIVAILGYGAAWAFAGPQLDAGAHTLAGAHAAQTDTAHADTGCDHVCHASAHMVGLHQESPTIGAVGAERFVRLAGCALATLAPPLPLKPPRS